METESLMQNDWVQLKKVVVFCKVREILDGKISGVTLSGSQFNIGSQLVKPVDLCRDILFRTGFWLSNNRKFKKSSKSSNATFEYNLDTSILTVSVGEPLNFVNKHEVKYLHELQQLYRMYGKEEIPIDLMRNKSSEYNRISYEERKQV